ncbi:MAG: hypothetical protein RLZZ628_3778 [Bacteroidota bacterium]
MGFHAIIARDSILLEFLEKQRLQAGAFFSWDLYENEDENFITFVSPYYKTSFNKILVEALEKQQAPLIDTLLHYNPILMTGYDEDSAWLKIQSYVKDKLERFEALVIEIKNKKNYTTNELKSFYDTDMLLSLNHLPDSFQKLRDDYGIALINLSGFSWNRGQYSFAQEVILIAQTLACSPRETRMIQERIKWYEDNLPASARIQSGGCASIGKNLLMICFVFVLFINLLRVLVPSAPSKDNQFNKYPDVSKMKIYFLPADAKRKAELDSLKNIILARPNGAATPALEAILAQYNRSLDTLETKKVNLEELLLDEMKHSVYNVRVLDSLKSKFE